MCVVICLSKVHKFNLTVEMIHNYRLSSTTRSALCRNRHQSPEWTILSHVNCSIQGKVIGFHVLLDDINLWYEGAPVVSSNGEAVNVLATVSSR